MKALKITFILVLLSFQAPLTFAQTSVDEYFERGEAAFEQGRYDEAIANYTKAIQLNADDAAAYVNRGVAYGRKGLYDRAIGDFEQALFLDPKNAAAQKNLEHARKLANESRNKALGQSESEQTTHKGTGKTIDDIISNAAQKDTRAKRSDETRTPLTKEEQKGLSEAMDRDAAAEFSSAIAPEELCDLLLKGKIDKTLPDGYSHPQISSTEMTAEERAGGMLCKISVNVQGPDPFNAIRFRVYKNAAAAERGLKSLAKMVPDITVLDDKVYYREDTPCMVYTAGNRPLTFVTCADQVRDGVIVVSGVASEPNNGNLWTNTTVLKAGHLLKAGLHSFSHMVADAMLNDLEGEKKK